MEKLKDIKGHVIRVGDKVAVVYKEYGYRKIKNAHLIVVTYLGKGQWGHNFKCGINSITIKEPECVRI